jgi:hypothetical protein
LVVHRDSNSQNGSSLGSANVHSFTLSYTPKNIRCDSRASFSARTLASPYFGHEPKAIVTATYTLFKNYIFVNFSNPLSLVDYNLPPSTKMVVPPENLPLILPTILLILTNLKLMWYSPILIIHITFKSLIIWINFELPNYF